MSKKLIRALRGLVLIIPLGFIFVSVFSNCSSGGVCSGDVAVTTEGECASYADENACDFSFADGVCDVFNCGNCEVIVDDEDPVFDVDDGDFF